jgi:NAD-dependent dihydropyrimidine dehydrogenase PreA subunit
MPKVIVDLDNCDGEGICVDVCPMNVFDMIEMSEYNNEKKSQPTRMEDCILCMACISACPTQAITVEE